MIQYWPITGCMFHEIQGLEEYFQDPRFHQNRTRDSGNVDGIRDLTVRFRKKTLFATAMTEVREAGFSLQKIQNVGSDPSFPDLRDTCKNTWMTADESHPIIIYGLKLSLPWWDLFKISCQPLLQSRFQICLWLLDRILFPKRLYKCISSFRFEKILHKVTDLTLSCYVKHQLQYTGERNAWLCWCRESHIYRDKESYNFILEVTNCKNNDGSRCWTVKYCQRNDELEYTFC